MCARARRQGTYSGRQRRVRLRYGSCISLDDRVRGGIRGICLGSAPSGSERQHSCDEERANHVSYSCSSRDESVSGTSRRSRSLIGVPTADTGRLRRALVGARMEACSWPLTSRIRTIRTGTGRTVGDFQGSRLRAPMFDRTTVKCRRSSVAMSLVPSRSAAAITDASTVPSGRSW